MVMPALTADYFKKLAGKIDAGRLTLEAAGCQLVDEAKNASLLDHVLAVISGIFDYPRLPLFFVIAKGEINARKATVAATIKATPPRYGEVNGHTPGHRRPPVRPGYGQGKRGGDTRASPGCRCIFSRTGALLHLSEAGVRW